MQLNHIQQRAVIKNESGIISKYGKGFHIPSSFAKNNLFYILWGSQYTCNRQYEVVRDYLSSFLLMHVLKGSLTVEYKGVLTSAPAGSIVFLDLRVPHRYTSDSDTLLLQQYMINGNATQSYFKLLYENNGPVFPCSSHLSSLFHSMQKEFNHPFPDDHILSMLIHEIFCSLTTERREDITDPIQLAKSYIQNHFNEIVSLDDIATCASMSRYYFSRKFRQEVGCTPWNYLLQFRILHAKNLLTKTCHSIEKIAELCGFSGTSHFIRTFKKETGITPQQFRKTF